MRVNGIFETAQEGMAKSAEQFAQAAETIAKEGPSADGMVEAMSSSNIFLANAKVLESAQDMYDAIMSL